MEKYLNKIDKVIKLYNKAKEPEAFEIIKQLRETILYDMALKNSKNKYDKEQLKSAKALLKDVSNDRPLFKKMYKVDDSYQLVDGYTAVVLKEPIVGLELNTSDGEYLDCRTIINRSGKNHYEYDNDYKEVKIDLLELEQLSLKIKKYKERPYPTEMFGHNFNTYYDPTKLLIAIKILGTENVKVYFHTTNGKDPIYLKSDLGESIVLPIFVPNEKK